MMKIREMHNKLHNNHLLLTFILMIRHALLGIRKLQDKKTMMDNTQIINYQFYRYNRAFVWWYGFHVIIEIGMVHKMIKMEKIINKMIKILVNIQQVKYLVARMLTCLTSSSTVSQIFYEMKLTYSKIKKIKEVSKVKIIAKVTPAMYQTAIAATLSELFLLITKMSISIILFYIYLNIYNSLQNS